MMKSYVLLFIFILLSGPIFAAWIGPPLITHNVHVLSNATVAQCKSSWMGSGNPETPTSLSGYGEQTYTTANVLSCTGCGIDPHSGDCVCRTCYNNFN